MWFEGWPTVGRDCRLDYWLMSESIGKERTGQIEVGNLGDH